MSGALAELRRRLPDERPCEEAVNWLEAGDYPSLQAAWEVCQRGDWMEWLSNLLLRGDTEALRAYWKVTAAAGRVYWEAMAPALRAYWEATATATAERAYWEARSTAERAYNEATASAGRKVLPVLPPELGGAA